MENKSSDKPLISIVESFIKELMAAGYKTDEICFTLVEQATVLGIEVAPSSELAMIVVMDGMKSGCTSKLDAEEVEQSDAEEQKTAPTGATLH